MLRKLWLPLVAGCGFVGVGAGDPPLYVSLWIHGEERACRRASASVDPGGTLR